MTYPDKGGKVDISIESLREARKKRLIITLLTVYADDSADEKCERIFAIAGVMGTQEQWDELKIKWTIRTEGIDFHATDCEADQGDYRYIPHEKNLKLYEDLTKLLASSELYGFGVVMDLEAYNTFIPHDYEDAPYMFCFSRVVGHFAKKIYEVDKNQRVEFIFDTNPKVHYSAGYLYDNFLTTCKDWGFCSVLEDKIAFASRKTVGIQVADLYAKEIMKRIDNEYGPVKRKIRKSFIVLKDTKKFYFDYYGREWFEPFSKNLSSLQKHYGMEDEKITEWLIKHKRVNANGKINLRGEDLVNYIIDLDSKDKDE